MRRHYCERRSALLVSELTGFIAKKRWKPLVEESQIAGRTRPATEHMVRKIGTDLAWSIGLRSKEISSRRGRFFSWLLPL